MHNNYGLHELLYTGEHYTCNNYLSDIGIGFVYKEFDEGSQLHRNCFMQYNHLIFIIEGNCTVSCNQFTGRHFKSGEMVLIPRSSAFRGQADSPMKIIDMAFEVPISGCDRLILHNYFPLCQNMKYDFYSHSNFNRFSKENFGCSPTRLVETYRKIRQNENK